MSTVSQNPDPEPTPEPLTPEQALVRLRQYMERPAPTWSTASYGNSAAESTLARIGRTLAAEVARLKAENAELDRSLDEVIRERDNLHEVADKLAYAIAPMEVIGEHSSGNDPWENALDHVTPFAEVTRLRTQVRFLLEQVRRKDAESGEGNRALAEFLAADDEAKPPVCPVCQNPGCCCRCFGKQPAPDCPHQTDGEPEVPRTERSRWQAIADALNAVDAIGIDLDGTITDHRMWSVVWDRAAERWVVAGYHDDTAVERASRVEGCGTCGHLACLEQTPCGALLSVGVTAESRCDCTTGQAARAAQTGGEPETAPLCHCGHPEDAHGEQCSLCTVDTDWFHAYTPAGGAS